MSKLNGFQVIERKLWQSVKSQAEITEKQLQGLADKFPMFDPVEIKVIYQPLLALLELKIAEQRKQNHQIQRWYPVIKAQPFIIGIAGSVAVGKSTMAELLVAMLKIALPKLSIELISTDSFLYNNAYLQEHSLMQDKGFPISYDTAKFVEFLKAFKQQSSDLKIPIYSHQTYDILADEQQAINKADVLIVEGINALQRIATDIMPIDLMDYKIYIDADESMIEKWFLERFEKLVLSAKPKTYYYQFKDDLPAGKLLARKTWANINVINLHRYIAPSINNADLVLIKEEKHHLKAVAFRKY